MKVLTGVVRFRGLGDTAFMKLLGKLGKVPETGAPLLGKGFVVELDVSLDAPMAGKKCWP